MDTAGWPSESRRARRASEFLRTVFPAPIGTVVGISVSEPVGVGGSAVLGAGRGGGGMDTRWFPREIENVLTCCGDEFVVATLYMLLDVLARFEAICRPEMILGKVFCD